MLSVRAGKIIRQIVEETGAKINVDDEGPY